MENMSKALRALREQAVRLLKAHRRASQDERTALNREIAETFVACREHFLQANGEPDWRGRTYAYRVFIRDMFDDAAIPDEERARLQALLRYHISAVVRERLDADTLEAYGLQPQTARERSHERHVSRSALISALTAKDVAGGALYSVMAARRVLAGVDSESLADLDAEEREYLDRTLKDVARVANGLRRRL